LKELETYYDLADVIDANIAIDLKEDAEAQANKDLNKK